MQDDTGPGETSRGDRQQAVSRCLLVTEAARRRSPARVFCTELRWGTGSFREQPGDQECC